MNLAARIGLCLALLGTSCERGALPAGGTEASHSQQPLPGFARADARLKVAHAGLRRLELTPVDGEPLAFDERIATDGHGRFALEPLQPLESSTLDWNGFELIHHLREGFFFRYRDFAVRDPGAFTRNWRVTDLGQKELVAGRSCERFRVERPCATPSVFELAVDPLTDLVLASTEYDAGGRIVARMTYTSIDLVPDLSRVTWHESANDETTLDPGRALGPQIEARALEPRLVPAGYAPLEAAVVRTGNAAWLKLTYCDGVQPLFFLHAINPSPHGKAGQVDAQEVGGLPSSTSAVVACHLGSALAIQGRVNDFDVIAVGKVSQAELLDLIESALP